MDGPVHFFKKRGSITAARADAVTCSFQMDQSSIYCHALQQLHSLQHVLLNRAMGVCDGWYWSSALQDLDSPRRQNTGLPLKKFFLYTVVIEVGRHPSSPTVTNAIPQTVVLDWVKGKLSISDHIPAARLSLSDGLYQYWEEKETFLLLFPAIFFQKW